MMDGIKEESVGFLFNLEVSIEEGEEELEEVEAFEPMRQPVPDFSGPVVESAPAEPPTPEMDSAAAAFVREAPHIRAKGLERSRQPQHLSYSAPSEDGDVEVKGATVKTADDPFAKVGRNAQCPCGSGKKYKMCHGRPGGPTGLTARAAGG
jgi:preprotein translocase subunit SecA